MQQFSPSAEWVVRDLEHLCLENELSVFDKIQRYKEMTFDENDFKFYYTFFFGFHTHINYVIA